VSSIVKLVRQRLVQTKGKEDPRVTGRIVFSFHDCLIVHLLYNKLIFPMHRRSTEFSNAIKQTFEAAVLVELFPRSQIDIYVQILQSDGGTLVFLDCILMDMYSPYENCNTCAYAHAHAHNVNAYT